MKEYRNLLFSIENCFPKLQFSLTHSHCYIVLHQIIHNRFEDGLLLAVESRHELQYYYYFIVIFRITYYLAFCSYQ